jgi:hypothetical protein
VGGGSYNHSSFGQSIIIVDEELQRSLPGKVTGHDVAGPVQFVQCMSDEHYPGSTITRTFALLDRTVLVVDRVVSAKPRMVDWYLKGAGRGISVPLEPSDEPLTDKPDDNRIGARFGNRVPVHEHGVTAADWTAMDGVLRMLGAPDTEVINVHWGGGKERKGRVVYMNNDLIVRRDGVRTTEYVACLSNDVESMERVPVRKAGGGQAEAVGLKIVLKDGTTFHAVINFEPEGTDVSLGDLKTAGRFATDYEP